MSPNNDTNAKNSRGDKQLPAHRHLTEAEAALSDIFPFNVNKSLVFLSAVSLCGFLKRKKIDFFQSSQLSKEP